MSAYTARLQKKQKQSATRQERAREFKIAKADTVITRFLDAYQAVHDTATIVTYNGRTGRYRWNGYNLTTQRMTGLAAAWEAEFAALINPDEESS
jgi:hypothetical protein